MQYQAGLNLERHQNTWPIMGNHHILTSVHAPKQVLAVMGFAHHEDSAY